MWCDMIRDKEKYCVYVSVVIADDLWWGLKI